MIISPAITKVSLLANAISIPFFTALIVGISPDFPTNAVSTISGEQYFKKLFSDSSPK